MVEWVSIQELLEQDQQQEERVQQSEVASLYTTK
jgi:hypothetical protein